MLTQVSARNTLLLALMHTKRQMGLARAKWHAWPAALDAVDLETSAAKLFGLRKPNNETAASERAGVGRGGRKEGRKRELSLRLLQLFLFSLLLLF